VSGHGANASSLSVDDTSRDELQGDVGAVLGWLADQPTVDRDRLSLVGHSMGAGAVTRFAIDNPDAVRVTVAISLPSAIEPVNTPRDLLLLYGSAEPAGFANAARDQLESIRPGSAEGVVYGDLDDGTAISVEVIGGVEHISIVWSPSTAEAMLTWIGGAVDAPSTPVDLDPAWLWLILLLLAGCLAAIPLARWLYGTVAQPPEVRVAGWVAMVITVVASVAASVVAAVLGGVADSLIPLAVGGYLAVWFAIAATVIGVAMLWVRRYRRRDFGPLDTRSIAASLGDDVLCRHPLDRLGAIHLGECGVRRSPMVDLDRALAGPARLLLCRCGDRQPPVAGGSARGHDGQPAHRRSRAASQCAVPGRAWDPHAAAAVHGVAVHHPGLSRARGVHTDVWPIRSGSDPGCSPGSRGRHGIPPHLSRSPGRSDVSPRP